MKAIAKCPKCGKTLTSNCRGCIDGGEDYHKCKGKYSTVKVKWKVYPENEKEMTAMENE